MMGRLQSLVQRLGVALALVSALSLAGAAEAAPTNASKTDHADGLPCNDLCKAYMAWSDRMMAKFRPHPPQRPPEERIAARPKKPERTLHRASATRHSDLASFAQFHGRSDPTAQAQAVDIPQAEAAAPPSDPFKPIAERLLEADGNATARLARADSATNAIPEATPVSLTTASTSDMQAPGAEGPVATRLDLRFVLSLILALSICTLLALMYRGRSRSRTQAANSTFR
jgi:hypothetical protein